MEKTRILKYNIMIHKLIHISDLHIRTFKRMEEYQEVAVEFFKKIKVDLDGYEYNEARIVIVGDLVHQKITISNEQILFLSWFLQRCTKIAPTIIVAGNHDMLENNKDRVDSLTPIIKLMSNPNIYYFKESVCYVDENIVWCNYSLFENNKRPDIETSRKENKDKKFIGLLHAPIVGSTTNLGYKFETGIETDVFEGLDAVLLGDVHKYQKIEHKSTPIVFPSSLIQQDFGESVTKHGYVIWDVETLEHEHKEVESDYGFYKFKITSITDIETGKEKLLNQ